MVHAKNYETVSTLVKVMQKKPWPLFFPDTVYMVNSRCFILMKNSVRPDIVNYLTVGVVTAGVPLPSRLGSLGERCKLPQWGPGQSLPQPKTEFWSI